MTRYKRGFTISQEKIKNILDQYTGSTDQSKEKIIAHSVKNNGQINLTAIQTHAARSFIIYLWYIKELRLPKTSLIR